MVEHCPTVRLQANALHQLARQRTVFDLVNISKRRFVTPPERITFMRQAVREGEIMQMKSVPFRRGER